MKHRLIFNNISIRFSSSFPIAKIDCTRHRVHRYLDDAVNNMASCSSEVKNLFAIDNFEERNSIIRDIKFFIEIFGAFVVVYQEITRFNVNKKK